MLADFTLEGQSQVMALPPFLKEVLPLNHRTQKTTCHLLEQHPRRPGEKQICYTHLRAGGLILPWTRDRGRLAADQWTYFLLRPLHVADQNNRCPVSLLPPRARGRGTGGSDFLY